MVKSLSSQVELNQDLILKADTPILDIASQFTGRSGYIQKIPIFKHGGPVETLWNISIEPILDAFFGNLDELQKKEHLKEMKEILLNVKK